VAALSVSFCPCSGTVGWAACCPPYPLTQTPPCPPQGGISQVPESRFPLEGGAGGCLREGDIPAQRGVSVKASSSQPCQFPQDINKLFQPHLSVSVHISVNVRLAAAVVPIAGRLGFCLVHNNFVFIFSYICFIFI